MAFQMRDDAPYDITNNTLVNGVIIHRHGNSTAQRGYWGDIVNSPYIAFGSYSDDKEILKKINDKYVKVRNIIFCVIEVVEYNRILKRYHSTMYRN